MTVKCCSLLPVGRLAVQNGTGNPFYMLFTRWRLNINETGIRPANGNVYIGSWMPFSLRWNRI